MKLKNSAQKYQDVGWSPRGRRNPLPFQDWGILQLKEYLRVGTTMSNLAGAQISKNPTDDWG